jgi:hypothetical protein
MFLLAGHKAGIKFICPENDAAAKLRYTQKATKSFGYDEDTKVCKNRLDKLAISTYIFYGENHLHYFTHENSNNCVVCGAAIGIL